MWIYRITKYNPEKRNKSGAYLLDEWTGYDQLGKKFDSEEFTLEEYEKVEAAYIDSAIDFLESAGVRELTVKCLDLYDLSEESEYRVSEGASYGLDQLRHLFQGALRNEFSAKFESDDPAFVHFGWDYYMYVGVMDRDEGPIERAAGRGLFVEDDIPRRCSPEFMRAAYNVASKRYQKQPGDVTFAMGLAVTAYWLLCTIRDADDKDINEVEKILDELYQLKKDHNSDSSIADVVRNAECHKLAISVSLVEQAEQLRKIHKWTLQRTDNRSLISTWASSVGGLA